ncbi:MAG TPA: carboxypeptidase-like regulatory domain-containing protein [Bacteroidia bacterium]|nr:carboxypeptidase-like regulatory domain-containing protein [Bacteroidia bacterium]
MKVILIALSFILISLNGLALNGDKNQLGSRQVSGVVMAPNGESIPGARIKVKENGTEYFSDFSGKFRIPGSAENLHLVVESLGYQPLEISLSDLENSTELSLKSL